MIPVSVNTVGMCGGKSFKGNSLHIHSRFPGDARDAQEDMDGYRLDGRDLQVIFAQDRRKTGDEMRQRTAGRGGGRDR